MPRYRPAAAHRVLRFWRIVRRDGQSLADASRVPLRWTGDRAQALPFTSRREAEVALALLFVGAAAAREHGIRVEPA